MRKVQFCSLLLVCLAPLSESVAFAQVQAENQVPVILTKVVRMPTYTEIQLEAQAALNDVCWYSSGPNSPYLLSANHRYHFLDGNNIAACPMRQNYGVGGIMTLRFEPVDMNAGELSLVEGQGGENQMVDPKSSRERFWNFLHVSLR